MQMQNETSFNCAYVKTDSSMSRFDVSKVDRKTTHEYHSKNRILAPNHNSLKNTLTMPTTW